MTRNSRKIMLTALLLMTATAAAADEKPLWELGAGFATLSFPAYRGSDQRTNFAVPVPYLIYRGDFLKADRRGVRGRLFDSDRFELSLSSALSPPVASDNVTARADMPDLKASFEFGPEIDMTLWHSPDRARTLRLLVPLRAAFTLEGSPRDIGWVLHPKLNLDIGDLLGLDSWSLGLQAGPLFGDARQNAYYYSVAPRYAVPRRPAYRASGGYAGAQYLAAVSKRFPGYWIGAFVRYDSLSHSAFEDSPLLRSKHYLAGGFGISWILGKSSTVVSSDD